MTAHEVTLRYLPAQMAFSEAEEDVVAFVGGIGCGKSMVAADVVLEMVSRYPFCNPEPMPGQTLKDTNPAIAIFSNTYPQLIEGTMHTFFERCAFWGIPYINRIRTEHRVYLPTLNAVLGVWSVDDPETYKSLELCFAWVDEAQYWDKEAYDFLIGRLRGTATQRERYPDMPLRVRITANPPHTLDHWLVDLCTKPTAETGAPAARLITASTYDNPFLPPSYITNLKASYDPEIAEIEMGGKFGEIGKGRIWRMFSRARHVWSEAQALERGLPPLRYDVKIPLCWSHDFNVDPLCSIFFQWRRVNVTGFQHDVMYVIDEMQIPHSRVELAVKEFAENRLEAVRIAQRSELILYGDASGQNQTNRQTGVSDFAALKMELARRHFAGELKVHEGNPKIVDRHAAGNRMLMDAQERIGVVIHERCINLIRDLERMYYKPGTRVVEIQKVKDGKLKKTFTHLADAWSYPIEYEYPYVEPSQSVATTQR